MAADAASLAFASRGFLCVITTSSPSASAASTAQPGRARGDDAVAASSLVVHRREPRPRPTRRAPFGLPPSSMEVKTARSSRRPPSRPPPRSARTRPRPGGSAPAACCSPRRGRRRRASSSPGACARSRLPMLRPRCGGASLFVVGAGSSPSFCRGGGEAEFVEQLGAAPFAGAWHLCTLCGGLYGYAA